MLHVSAAANGRALPRVCCVKRAGTAMRSIAGNATCLPCHVAKFWPAYLFIARRRLLPTVSTRPRTPASTLMPDEEDGRHVFNAGPDLSDAEMTDGCESPILSVVRPSATSNTSHDIFDEHSRRFYRPALKANNRTTSSPWSTMRGYGKSARRR